MNLNFTRSTSSLSEVLRRAFFVLCALLLIISGSYAQSSLFSVSSTTGKLVYTNYANQGQANAANRIPDYSYAGYMGGGVALPASPPVRETITNISSADARARIQDAIDRVSALPLDANGFRGTVLIKAGTYNVSGTLYIRASGVVVKGEGNGPTGTVLIATLRSQHDFIIFDGPGTGKGNPSGTVYVPVTNTFLGTGSKTLSVGSHSFSAGDNVVIRQSPNQTWINTINMDDVWWAPSDIVMHFERKILSVTSNSITIDAPIVMPIESRYATTVVYEHNLSGGRIKKSGLENMRLESYFASDTDEAHGWHAVDVQRSENCWVKGIVAKYFGNGAVNCGDWSRYITVEDCAMVDPKSKTEGGRKYSFGLENEASGVLYQRCATWGDRHDFVAGSRVPGPSAYVDGVSYNATSDMGPHSRWATGLVLDNLYGFMLRVHNRGTSGGSGPTDPGHGWVGGQIMFYNCETTPEEIHVDSPPTARNYGIGCKAPTQIGNGYWQSWGTRISNPRSLYFQQLQDRLGSTAVDNVTTADQRNGLMRQKLIDWVVDIQNDPRVVWTEGSAIPAAPSNLVATANSSSQITVTWNDNSTDEDKFYLQQSTDGTTFVGVTNPPANTDGTASYVVTGLTAGTRYWFRVRSENTAGKSAYSNIDDATTLSAGTTYYRIKVVNDPTFVLNAASTTLTNGTNVNVYTSGTSTAQQWQLIDTDSGYKRIASRINSDYVLDCSATPANGVNVQLWNWTGNTRQQWLLTDIGGGAYKITVRADALQGLDCSTTPANNVNVQMWNYVGNTRQQWIVEPVSGGTAAINDQASLSLDNQASANDLQLQYLANSGSDDGKVSFNIPTAAQTTVEVFNLNGQKVAELLNSFTASGNHLVNFNSNGLSKGIYVIKLSSGNQTKTVKIILN